MKTYTNQKAFRGVVGCSAALLVCLSILTGCGAKDFRIKQAPESPLQEFGHIEVRPLAIEIPGMATLDPKVQENIQNFARSFPAKLQEELREEGLFKGDASKTLVLQGKLIEYDPGSQAARYFIGPCSGAGTIIGEIQFTDGGTTVASGDAVGGVTCGWFGGFMGSAESRFRDAVENFIRKNYSQIEASR